MVDETVIDNDAISHVLGVGGEALLKHLIELFVDMVPERLAAAKRACAAGDLETVYQEAHALRSAAGNLGVVKVASLAAALELRAKSGEADGVDKLLNVLEERFDQAQALLRQRAEGAIRQATAPVLPPVETPAPEGQKARLVLVEDNIDGRVLIETILGQDYALSSYDHGQEALAAMQTGAPDLLLLDISLPDMDGVEILSKVRNQDSLRTIPVVALTAHAMAGDKEEFLKLGFDAYLSKPIEESLLRETVERLLREREASQ